MRAVVQRVREAAVHVDGTVVGAIGRGLCVLLGVAAADRDEDAERLCRKVLTLRIFADEAGRFDRSLLDVGGALLVVSQFTLYGDCRRGRRPSFSAAAPTEQARALYERFVSHARSAGVDVATGRFQAHMALALVNDGPVTLLLETAEDAA
ncbi:MAG TPA: D-aminoacyl-tRNA deacylase [Candidatus Limnocylindria bacterium]|nr:D-aminoacyl-tRNA deacylase [Candidatus Limnocylindria bacterium]